MLLTTAVTTSTSPATAVVVHGAATPRRGVGEVPGRPQDTARGVTVVSRKVPAGLRRPREEPRTVSRRLWASRGPRRRWGRPAAQNPLLQAARDGGNPFPHSSAAAPLSTGYDFCRVCKAGPREPPSPRFPQASPQCTSHGLPAAGGTGTKSRSLHLSNAQ